MKHNDLLAVLVLLVATSTTTSAQQSLPRQISYQGVVDVDNLGKHPPSITTLTIRIYDSENGGTLLHEEVFSSTSQHQYDSFYGTFNVALGGTKPFSASMLFDRQYWLSAQIDGGNPSSPRTPFTAAPYALRSATSERAAVSEDAAPMGTIVAYFGPSTTVPSGWLLCDGRDASGYPELAAMLRSLGYDNRTPDLRGMFLRGANLERTGDFSDPDNDRRHLPAGAPIPSTNQERVGTLQGDTVGPHYHRFDWGAAAGTQGDIFTSPPGSGKSANPASVTSAFSSVRDKGADGIGAETRPNNASVNWIIKAR